MSYESRVLAVEEFPPLLREIPQPPSSLRLRGNLPSPHLPLLTVVGSRHYTSYATEVITTLIGGLRGTEVGIVSGLAIGIDGLAHEAALANGLYTLAIPGSGLGDSVLYPRRHQRLARRILESGGGLLSEYEDEQSAARWTFPERNRLVAGIAPATLLIEAGEKSGTLITARMCVDYNRELLIVPGSIFSKNSFGVHQFLKLGATAVTTAEDIKDVLGLVTTSNPQTTLLTLNHLEAKVVSLLVGPTDINTIIRSLELPAGEVTTLLMQLTLRGVIIEQHGLYRAVI